ncbi:hypothetical protein R6Q57_007759 [Mikania cordata]
MNYKIDGILLHGRDGNFKNILELLLKSYGYGQKHKKDGLSSWKSDLHKVTNILMHKDDFEDVNEAILDAHYYVKNNLDYSRHFIQNGIPFPTAFRPLNHRLPHGRERHCRRAPFCISIISVNADPAVYQVNRK